MMCTMKGSAGLYVTTKGMVSVRVKGLSLSASVRATSEARCIWVVVTAIGKVVYKLISMKYVTSMLYG